MSPVLPGILARQRPKSLLKREQKSLSPGGAAFVVGMDIPDNTSIKVGLETAVNTFGIVWISSDEASYFTGAVLSIDRGITNKMANTEM